MGIFSSKKVVYVASVAYNMAGPLTDRLSVLKSTVSRHVLLGEKKISLGRRMIDTQLSGPTMDQRAWFRWAKTHYELGEVSGHLENKQMIDGAVVAPFITVPSGYWLTIDSAFIDSGDITYWAEQHILATRGEDFETDWIADYNETTGEMQIQYEDLSTETISVPGFSRTANYVVAYYTQGDTGVDPEDGNPLVFLYRIGDGNATLDALYVSGSSNAEFFPAIPLRINNKPISHADFEDEYPLIEKAYKRAFGGKLVELLDSIEDNENIDDVDHATVVFGVEITTQEKCGLRYLYQFFKSLIPGQANTPLQFATHMKELGSFCTNVATIDDWLTDNLGGTTPAVVGYKGPPGTSTLKVSGTDPLMAHHDIRLSWITIDEEFHSGLGKVGVKRGDLWFEDRPTLNISGQPKRIGSPDSGITTYVGAYKLPYSRLFWQTGDDTYKVLHLFGMVHQNFVYGSKAVELSTSDALSGDDEEGFIVPLHYPTLAKMPLVQSNQLALSNRHVVFNCYQIVKIRWYERGIFKILISVVLSIVMSFIFPGAVGLLGTALQVGTFLGFNGMTAIIVGAAVNALASMVLMTIIEKAAIAIFGEAWGRLIGQIVAFITVQAVHNFAMGAGFTVDWGQLMRMENLMKLLNSATQGVSGWIQGEMVGIQDDMTQAQKDFKSDWEDLEKKAFDALGAGGGVIDPLMFTQSQSRFLDLESRDAFLQRTLMTGTDLIDLSMTMIEDFAELNLTVDTENI